MWVPESAILKRQEELSSRFARTLRINGTRSLRYFEPVSLSVLKVGLTSLSSTDQRKREQEKEQSELERQSEERKSERQRQEREPGELQSKRLDLEIYLGQQLQEAQHSVLQFKAYFRAFVCGPCSSKPARAKGRSGSTVRMRTLRCGSGKWTQSFSLKSGIKMPSSPGDGEPRRSSRAEPLVTEDDGHG
ncbi:hypothetical protein MTO96_025626 [Rhipicephalus appendiculatus]